MPSRPLACGVGGDDVQARQGAGPGMGSWGQGEVCLSAIYFPARFSVREKF
jgi:hypothetical protein